MKKVHKLIFFCLIICMEIGNCNEKLEKLKIPEDELNNVKLSPKYKSLLILHPNV